MARPHLALPGLFVTVHLQHYQAQTLRALFRVTCFLPYLWNPSLWEIPCVLYRSLMQTCLKPCWAHRIGFTITRKHFQIVLGLNMPKVSSLVSVSRTNTGYWVPVEPDFLPFTGLAEVFAETPYITYTVFTFKQNKQSLTKQWKLAQFPRVLSLKEARKEGMQICIADVNLHRSHWKGHLSKPFWATHSTV